MSGTGETSMGGKARAFPDTLWTVVIRAQDRSSEDYRDALNELVKAYWKPVYYYVRHRGLSREVAKDLTQGFFATFLEKDYVNQFDRAKGRFKTFVLVTLKHYLSKQRERESAQKRGGRSRILSGDFDEIERQLAPSLGRHEDPEKTFGRQWALSVLQRAMRNLEAECSKNGREMYYRVLLTHMTASAEHSTYRDIAEELGIGEGDVRNYLHRVRARLREHIVNLIQEYVTDDKLVEKELQELFTSL